MNVEIVTEAVQFPKKEYINRIFLAVHGPDLRVEGGRAGAYAHGDLLPQEEHQENARLFRLKLSMALT
jgi:hypothetical protein